MNLLKLSKKKSTLKKKSKKIGGNADLQISTYNILARKNTHHNWRNHRNIEPDLSNFQLEKKGNKKLLVMIDERYESIYQTRDRYSIIVDDILTKNSDLVCLQECELNFFDDYYNPNAKYLLKKYHKINNLETYPLEKNMINGVCILLKKGNNLKKTYRPVFTEFNKYLSESKGAILFPIVDSKNNPLWIVSAHFHSNSNVRQEMVLDIEHIYNTYEHPYLKKIKKKIRPTLIVLGDFNIEGDGAIISGRRNYMAMEFGDIPNSSKFIYPFKSFWYNSNNILTNGLMTGLDGLLTTEKNIDHIFVYPNNRFKYKIEVMDVDEEYKYGPYEENERLSERIGGRARNNQMNLKHIKTFIESGKGPSNIVRGSDHKMITLSLTK